MARFNEDLAQNSANHGHDLAAGVTDLELSELHGSYTAVETKNPFAGLGDAEFEDAFNAASGGDLVLNGSEDDYALFV